MTPTTLALQMPFQSKEESISSFERTGLDGLGRFAAQRGARPPLNSDPLERMRVRTAIARVGLALVLILYLMTWAVGIPQVASGELDLAVQGELRFAAQASTRPSIHYNRFRVAFAPLPFVVVAYHEFSGRNVGGQGCWKAYLWWWGRHKAVYENWTWWH